MMSPITTHGERLRICWGSNSPLTPGGYGQTTALVVQSLRDILGCDMAISSTYGQMNGQLLWHGIPIYPQGYAMFGNDIHAANAERHHAHILLTHQDVPWQDPNQLVRGGTRWVSWAPIDHEPLSFAIKDRWHEDYCYQPIAVSRFGEKVAREAGIDIRCVVQGVDTSVFVPGDRAAARQALGWPEDAFIVGIIAQNRGYPDRKAYDRQLPAFVQFARKHRDALIYIHAFPDDALDPEARFDLRWLLGDMVDRAIWAHPYDLNMGYSVEQMVLRYQALDVLSATSRAEGFGLPIIEAQSCGVPVLTGAWTAMRELFFAGWMLGEEESEPWRVAPYRAYWRDPHEQAIAEWLEVAYSTLQTSATRTELAAMGRAAMVEHHDQAMLTETQWRPVLAEIARRIEAEPIPFHIHVWPGYGRPYADHLVEACGVAGCTAERVTTRDGQHKTHHTGAPIVVGGIALDLVDDPRGGVTRDIAHEIEQVYGLPDLEFAPGDIILDVGAHVGVVSCYLAKKWPETRIYAFEPVEANYQRLHRNLAANDITNVTPFQAAVTAESGQYITLAGDPSTNTGHYSAYDDGPAVVEARTLALPDLLRQEGIARVALLKLDCEGAEYEILYGLGRDLGKVDALVMEVHENAALEARHGSGAKLVEFVRLNVPLVRASVITIPDAEEVAV